MTSGFLAASLAAIVVVPGCHSSSAEDDDGSSATIDASTAGDGDAIVPACVGPGELDPSFGSGGVVRVFGLQLGNPTGIGGPVNVDASGRIVVAGEHLQPGVAEGLPLYRSCAVARLTANGERDPSFAGGNVVLQSVDGSPCRYQAIAFQSDGKIVVAGKVDLYTQPRAIVARYLDDGQLDTSFGDDGIILSPPQSSATGILVDSAGGVVVAGVSGTADDDASWSVHRYLSDGTLDTSFGVGGSAVPVFAGSSFDVAYGAAPQANGRFVVAGSVAASFSDRAFVGVVRYHANGAKDPSFAASGELLFSTGDDSLAAGVALDSSGRVLVVGLRDTVESDESEGVLVRLTTTGELDTSFGTAGVVVDRRGPPLSYAQVAIDAVGNVLAFGYEQDPITGSQAVLARYTDGGTRDTSFGAGGFGVPLPLGSTQHVGISMVVQPDGRAIAAGNYFSLQPQSSDIFVARYCQ